MVAERRIDLLLGDVVQHHVIAGQRDDMGDAAAHLAGADDADLADGSHVRIRLSRPDRRGGLSLALCRPWSFLLNPLYANSLPF